MPRKNSVRFAPALIMEPFAGPEQTARLARHLDAMETRAVRDLTALLALDDSSGVDGAQAE